MKEISAEEHDLTVLKARCRSFLNPTEEQNHGQWIKMAGNLYSNSFNIVVPEDGEDYNVWADLKKEREGRKIKYKLSFNDIEDLVLDGQKYRPLRTLGALVFN